MIMNDNTGVDTLLMPGFSEPNAILVPSDREISSCVTLTVSNYADYSENSVCSVFKVPSRRHGYKSLLRKNALFKQICKKANDL